MIYPYFRIGKDGTNKEYSSFNDMISKTKSISDVIEDSDNRGSDIEEPTEFSNLKYSNNLISFAKYKSDYHPFTYDSNINTFYKNGNTAVNKGACAKGFAPVLTERYNATSSWYSDITYEFKYVGTGNALEDGDLYVYKDSSLISTIKCPSCIIITLQGSGGGGAGGGPGGLGGDAKDVYGGGCGAFCYFHIEMPYLVKTERKVFKVTLGHGGRGGSSESSGSTGNPSHLEFYDETFGGYRGICYAYGGRGGRLYSSNSVGNGGDDTIPKIGVDLYNSVNSSILGKTGYGRITIVKSARNTFVAEYRSGVYEYLSYIPGTYYDPASINNKYRQANKSTPILSSGYYRYFYRLNNPSTCLAYLVGKPQEHILALDNVYGIFGNTRRTHVMYCGLSSMSGVGGSVGTDATGGDGGYGAGGGAGAHDRSGGDGGRSQLKIYW